MRSFSSSAINKSGKKFAPKAPARRPAPRAPPAPTPPAPSASRRSSVVRQAPPSQPDKPVTETPPAASEASAVPVPVPVTAPAPAPVPTPEPVDEPPASTEAPTKTAVSGSVAQDENSPAPESATPIPIPAPRQKTSVPAPATKVLEPVTASPQFTPQPSSAVATEPTPLHPIENERHGRIEDGGPASEKLQADERPGEPTAIDLHPKPRRPSGTATDVRPAKRQRTTAQRKITVEKAEPAPAQTMTPTSTRATPPGTEETNEIPNEIPDETASDVTTVKERKTTKPRRRVNNGGPRRSRARKEREPTPEGADSVEIAPAAVKMSELCKDLRTGKMSKRETELRNMDVAEMEKKQKAQQEGESPGRAPVSQNKDTDTAPAEQDGVVEKQPQAGPVMRIVNGEIVLDTASLQVDRHADAARNVGELEDVVETSLTRKINQASFGKRSKTESWDEEMTDLFYRGLRMFGTDFMMISKIFPGRSRRQIKLKFNNEERRDPERIKQTLLGPSETIDIATYSEMTNTVYDDPKVIQQELDEDKKRIEGQHAKEKEAQDELLRNPDGVNGIGKGADSGNGVAAKGKIHNNKKQPVKSMGGGTEEVVGSIDDFPLHR